MLFPTIEEYKDALRSAEHSLNKLSDYRLVYQADGKPWFSSGNLAVVFKMKHKNSGKFIAIKCFTREQERRIESYRLIAEELKDLNSSYLVQFEFLENELWVNSKVAGDGEYPVLKMDWVEGDTLGVFLKDNKNIGKIAEIEEKFTAFAAWLLVQRFAHGDLKPDNLIICNSNIVLIDYDGMFVPSMAGQSAREFGSPGYNKETNSYSQSFNKSIDEYALIALHTEIRVLNNSIYYGSIDGEDLRDSGETILRRDVLNTLISNQLATNDSEELELYLSFYQAEFNTDSLNRYAKYVFQKWQQQQKEQPNGMSDRNWQSKLKEDKPLHLLQERIEKSVRLANYCRRHLDPIDVTCYNFWITCLKVLYNLVNIEKFKLIGTEYEIPKNDIESRKCFLLSIEDYALRFVLVDFLRDSGCFSFSHNIFGGKDDVFTSVKHYGHKPQFDEFTEYQRLLMNEKGYSHLAKADIKNFYSSVNTEVLSSFIHEKLRKSKDFAIDYNTIYSILKLHIRDGDALIQKDGLMTGNSCEEYLANVFLSPIDTFFNNQKTIGYVRLMDDFRFMTYSKTNIEEGLNQLTKHLNMCGLTMNDQKTELFDTAELTEKEVEQLLIGIQPSELLHNPSLAKESIEDSIEKIGTEIRPHSFYAIHSINIQNSFWAASWDSSEYLEGKIRLLRLHQKLTDQPFLRYCLCRRYPLMLVPTDDKTADQDMICLLHYPWDFGWHFGRYFDETVQYDVEELPAFWQNFLDHCSTRY